MKKGNVSKRELLFNPHLCFTGDLTELLAGYPKRSEHLERYAVRGVNAKNLNPKFIKDGYMYLLRGASMGQETGFYSCEYAKGNTIENLSLDPNYIAFLQNMASDTLFISATTNFYVAASFAMTGRIYLLKIPIQDVYTFIQNELLEEEEYMIPDYIGKEEIIRSFRYDKLKQIYHCLKNEIGLSITPSDIGAEDGIEVVDKETIQNRYDFNNMNQELDVLFLKLKKNMLTKKLSREQIVLASDIYTPKTDEIAIFTDAYALYEPAEAILENMKKRGITEIYSLGNNIGLGPSPLQVMNLLEKYDVVSLQGNYEDMISLGTDSFISHFPSKEIQNIQWTKSKLGKMELYKIRSFPHSIHLDFQGPIGLCHSLKDGRCNDQKENELYPVSEQTREESFLYINSISQYLKIALALGMNQEDFIHCKSATEYLKKIRTYLKQNKKQLGPEFNGYISYIDDPLFYSESEVHSLSEYPYIITSDSSSDSKVKMDDTNIIPLRGVGMNAGLGEENLATYYIVRKENSGININPIQVPFDRKKMVDTIRNCESPNEMIMQYTKIRL